jgi:hypothetical protein
MCICVYTYIYTYIYIYTSPVGNSIHRKGLQEAVRMRYECLDSAYPPLKEEEAVIREKLLQIINQDH